MVNIMLVVVMVSVFIGSDVKEVVGIGVNFLFFCIDNKVDVVWWVIVINQFNLCDGIDVLLKVGGFDLVGMIGVMFGVVRCGLFVLLDGFFFYLVVLVVCQIVFVVRFYLILLYFLVEKGVCIVFVYLFMEFYLYMVMWLGEGSGVVLVMLIVEVVCVMFYNMGELVVSNIVLLEGNVNVI